MRRKDVERLICTRLRSPDISRLKSEFVLFSKPYLTAIGFHRRCVAIHSIAHMPPRKGSAWGDNWNGSETTKG